MFKVICKNIVFEKTNHEMVSKIWNLAMELSNCIKKKWTFHPQPSCGEILPSYWCFGLLQAFGTGEGCDSGWKSSCRIRHFLWPFWTWMPRFRISHGIHLCIEHIPAISCWGWLHAYTFMVKLLWIPLLVYKNGLTRIYKFVPLKYQ